ncbi:Cytochrome P450 [Melia azedarach]|uniref:Cytochrome P450 n=1 Tax=Melia azedarach TaxID=155640 RepID=A0ACC1XLP2_MELAZ|nr:Cytochrome P450 [Melia azedarach]
MIGVLLFNQLLEISLQRFALIPFFLSIFFVIKWLLFTHKSLPPSPSKLPVIGNLHQLGLHPHRSLRSLSQRYGPIMLLHLSRKPTYIISSADLARVIMKTHDILFANRPDSSISRRLLYNYRDLSMSPYGEYWRQMRSICVMKLLSLKRVQSFHSLREEETIEMIKKVERSCSGSTTVDLSEILVSLTKNVICRAAFGTTYGEGEGGRRLKKLLEELGELLGVFSVGDFIPWLGWVDKLTGLDAKVERVFKDLDNFLNGVIDDHMIRHDVVVLLSGRSKWTSWMFFLTFKIIAQMVFAWIERT